MLFSLGADLRLKTVHLTIKNPIASLIIMDIGNSNARNYASGFNGRTVRHAHPSIRKVPEITAYFWIVKILTTAMGEATSDFFVRRFSPVLAVVVAAIVLAIALILQISARKYKAWVYWFAVVMVAIFGTMAADVLHIRFGVPYLISTILFAITLTVVFYVWQKTEKTLSIHSIYTTRRELFYWATVMATFALGTAAGDMTATTLGLGYFSSGLLFTFLIAIPAVAYWKFGLNDIFAFWAAYVLTRPLGASFADWMGVPRTLGGLGYGRGTVSIVLTIIIVLFVWYLSVSRRDVKS